MEIAYYHFSNIDSTNNFAKSNIEHFDTNTLSVVRADEQKSGRGRMQRHWFSPQGNGYLSLVTFQDIAPFFATQLASLAVDDVLHECGIHSQIKWPNDLLANNKKIAGILTETRDRAIIIGIGLNINMSQQEAENIPQPATSMRIEVQKTFSIDAVVEKVVHRFATLLQDCDSNNQDIWLTRLSWMQGKEVEIFTAEGMVKACILSIQKDGKLEVLYSNGRHGSLSSGDIHI